jgi:hypothetical protein
MTYTIEEDRMIDAEIDDYIGAIHDCHMSAGLDGVRCGFSGRGKTIRMSLSWDSVTCPDCLAQKRDVEPWSVDIDTHGD